MLLDSPKEPKVIVLRNAQTEEDVAKMKEYKDMAAAHKKDKEKSKTKLPAPPAKPFGLYVVKGSDASAVEQAIVSHVLVGEPRSPIDHFLCGVFFETRVGAEVGIGSGLSIPKRSPRRRWSPLPKKHGDFDASRQVQQGGAILR